MNYGLPKGHEGRWSLPFSSISIVQIITSHQYAMISITPVIVWNPHYMYLIDDLEKRATNILRQWGRLNYQQRLKFSNLPTLAFRRNRDDMIEVYKILMGKYDPTLPSILHRNINSTTRGNPLKLCTYCPEYDLCKYNFSVRVTSLCHTLEQPLNTRDHSGFSR